MSEHELYGHQNNYKHRAFPKWGKRFGRVHKDCIGYVGTFTIDDAKLCLQTEDFGWKLGNDEHALAAKLPPLVEVRYSEDHGECESLVLITGMSELHLEHHEDHVQLHAMLQSLGYVCYNVGPRMLTDKYWGEGVHTSPEPVKCPDEEDGTPGPTHYFWKYRLPPYLFNLAVEGEEGDPLNGPTALKLKKRRDQYERECEQLLADRVAALKARVADEQTKPWYKKLCEELGPPTIDESDDEDEAKE